MLDGDEDMENLKSIIVYPVESGKEKPRVTIQAGSRPSWYPFPGKQPIVILLSQNCTLEEGEQSAILAEIMLKY